MLLQQALSCLKTAECWLKKQKENRKGYYLHRFFQYPVNQLMKGQISYGKIVDRHFCRERCLLYAMLIR